MQPIRALRTGLVAVAASIALVAATFIAPVAQAEDTQIRDLGVIPNNAVASYGSYMGELPEQGDRTWMAVNGNPVTVAQVDPGTNTVDWQLPLPDTDGGSWAVTATLDGTVFVGTWPDGVLHRKRPHETEFIALGKLTTDATWIWALTPGQDGTVYGGSYSDGNGDGRVFAWTEDDGFRDYGAAEPGVAYVRSIAEYDGVIYAGTGPVAHLIAIDAETGDKQEIAFPGDAGTYVHSLRAVDGNLYVHLGSGALVYNIADEQWNSLRSPGFGRAFSDVGPGGLVYADGGDSIVAIDAASSTATLVAENPLGGYLLSMRWVERDGKPILLSMNKQGLQIEYDPEAGSTNVVTPRVAGDIVQAHVLGVGPMDKIYASGYMIGGLSAYDLEADQFDATLNPIHQIEGMAELNGKMYLGTYTGAVIYEYDPTEPWQVGSNPHPVLNLEPDGQDRPFAMAAFEDTMVVGTVPNYGVLGGALSIYDPETESARTWTNIVQDQSVVSITSTDGIIYGGTSVYGGLAIAPTQEDGALFAFDPTTGEKLWETTPVPGQRSVSGLTVGPDNALYGMAGGTVFRTDPVTRESSTLATITTVNWAELDHYWADGYLNFNPRTQQFTGSVRGIVFELNQTTGSVTTVANATSWFAQDTAGRLYWTKGNHLFQATLPAAPSPSPSPSATASASVTPVPSATPSSSSSPSTPSTSAEVDVYSTPGFHIVNGRRWYTACEPYSQTFRCTTEIWSTAVHKAQGRFMSRTGWHFNNLTYLPFMTRQQWANNPLGHNGGFFSSGRQWRTECDTPATGRSGCRSFIWSRNLVYATQATDGSWSYRLADAWIFNNIVRFKSN